MRAKAYTFINIAGLALSLGCCILLARYRDRDWYLTTDPDQACRLSEADAQAVLQSIIPASERFLWTLQPIREKEGISC